jgi:hypothetical protein
LVIVVGARTAHHDASAERPGQLRVVFAIAFAIDDHLLETEG